MASRALEKFVDEGIKRGAAKGYHPSIFIGMRQQMGTIRAISKLVRSGDIQTGFTRLFELNLLDWTIENAVLMFPGEFDAHDIACARFRLEQAQRR